MIQMSQELDMETNKKFTMQKQKKFTMQKQIKNLQREFLFV